MEDLIILIHGTWANSKKGWCSSHDKFHIELNKELFKVSGRKFTITPFEWTGKNSHYERNIAASNLISTINYYKNNFKRIHLIGHSHGGTVIQLAFHQIDHKSNKQRDLLQNKIASWTTIGTPFFRFKGNLKIREKYLEILIWIILLPIHFILSIFLSLVTGISLWESAIMYVIFLNIISNYLQAKSFQYQLDLSTERQACKWLGIFSKYDEAITGLSNSMKHSLNNKKRTYPTFGTSTKIFSMLYRYVNVFLYNIFIRKILNQLLSKQIKKMSLGIDLNFFNVNKVSNMPTDSKLLDTTNLNIDEDLMKVVLEDNKRKIEKVRKLFHFNKALLHE